MAEVLPWQLSSETTILARAVQALAQGKLVAFPTDTGYSVAAHVLISEAIERLAQLKADSAPLLLAFPSPERAFDWAPQLSPLAKRLGRRCWPGPVTLVVGDLGDLGDLGAGSVGCLPEAVRQRLCSDGTLSLYVPGHDAIAVALLTLAAPLGLMHLAKAATPEDVQRMVGEHLALIVDDGPARAGRGMSAVRVHGNHWTMLHEGEVTAAEMARKTCCVIVFVCTGNTCRSPMAETLCVKLLAERLRCEVQELPDKGWIVISAGIAAMPGDRASPAAVEVVREWGADLTEHVSQPLSAEMVLLADHVLTMTRGHQMALAARFGCHGSEPRLLDPDGGDIADPVGGDREVYRAAQQILRHLEALLPELLTTVPVQA